MQIYFSTNAVPAERWEHIHDFLDEFNGKVGLEIFPEFHKPYFQQAFLKEKDYLMNIPCSLHGPYYESEYAVPMDSSLFKNSMSLLKHTLDTLYPIPLAYMVFHHSNMVISDDEKAMRLTYARENYEIVKSMCDSYGIPLAVENVTLKTLSKGLFTEQEFITECKRLGCKVLIDIGHCNLSGWNISNVINELKDQIVSYHIHNNYGHLDDHFRIYDGTINFDKFLDDYKKYTPNADLVLEYSPVAAKDIVGVKEDLRLIMKALRIL